MWLVTREGFLSVVEHRDNPNHLLVRGRTRDDLFDLQQWFQDRGAIAMAQDDTLYAIEEDPTADYRWRMKVGRVDFAAYLNQTTMDLHYTTNVKGTLDKGDHFRHDVLMDCWFALHRLQTRQPRYTATDTVPVEDMYDECIELWDVLHDVITALDNGTLTKDSPEAEEARAALYYGDIIETETL